MKYFKTHIKLLCLLTILISATLLSSCAGDISWTLVIRNNTNYKGTVYWSKAAEEDGFINSRTFNADTVTTYVAFDKEGEYEFSLELDVNPNNPTIVTEDELRTIDGSTIRFDVENSQ